MASFMGPGQVSLLRSFFLICRFSARRSVFARPPVRRGHVVVDRVRDDDARQRQSAKALSTLPALLLCPTVGVLSLTRARSCTPGRLSYSQIAPARIRFGLNPSPRRPSPTLNEAPAGTHSTVSRMAVYRCHIGLVGVADDGVPVGHRQLAGDQRRGAFGAVLDHLGQVASRSGASIQSSMASRSSFARRVSNRV